MIRFLLCTLLAGAAIGLAAAPAGATAPGRDGLIAFTVDGAIHTIAPDGGGNRLLLRNASSPAWSPGGRAIAFVRGRDIWVAAADGRRARRLATGGATPTWSSDGRWIAYVSADNDTIHRVSSDGGGAKVIGRAGHSPWPDYFNDAIDGSPSGNLLAYYGVFDFGTTLALDLTRLRFDGGGMRVLLDTGLPGRDGWAPSGHRVSWSPDGRTLAYDAIDYEPSPTAGAQGIAVGPAALATTVVAARHSSFHQSLAITSPDWSPRGTRLCGTVAGGLGVVGWPSGPTRVLVRAPGTDFRDCDWQAVSAGPGRPRSAPAGRRASARR